MHLSDRAIERPRLIILGAVVLCVLGFAAVFTLPKEREPRVRLPVVLAVISNPGGQPITNEREILRKIEEHLGTLSDLKDRGYVVSSAVDGAAVLQFTFDDGVDATEAKREVESLMNRVESELPSSAQTSPGGWQVNDIAFENWPIIQVVVAGGRGGVDRKQVAERLEEQINALPGIAGVDMFGGLDEEVLVEINPHTMTIYGVNYNQVEKALRSANVEAPSGAIESGGGRDIRVRASSKFKNLDEIRELPIGVFEGKPVELADIATVHMGYRKQESIARYHGADAVVLLVRAKTDIDVWATAGAVQDLVDGYVASGEAGDCHVGTVRSQAREIWYMLKQLGTSALYGTVLVIVILCLFLGWRNAMLISAALPLAILGTGALMWVSKRTIAPDLAINMMTLFATILVIGMVVDGCIIVGENIFRHRELGETPVLAAKKGINEVGGSLLGAYLTTFFAFAPMYLVRGIMGDYMQLLPTVVLFALCAAMLVDHFLLPVFSVYFMKVSKKRAARAKKEVKAIQDEAARQGETLTIEDMQVRDAQRIVNAGAIKRTYGSMLQYALRHRLLVLFLSTLVIATPVGLYSMGAIGTEFFPESDMPQIEVNFELPLGSSMELKTSQVANRIEAAVVEAVRPEEWHKPSEQSDRVGPVTTMGNAGALNTRLDLPTGTGPEFGMVYVELELAENRERSSSQIREAIKRAIPDLPGVIVRVTSPSEGPPAGAPVMLRVKGHDDVTLEELARRAELVEQLLKETPGVYDVASDFRLRPELTVEPNRTVARMFGVDTSLITSAQNYALNGREVGEVDFGRSESIKIRMRNQAGERDQVTDLQDLPLRGQSGQVVTVNQVASVHRTQTANIIRHYDQKRVINVRAELAEGMTVESVKANLVRQLRPELTAAQQHALVNNRQERVLKADNQVMIEFGGEIEVRDDALEDLMLALVVAASLIMIVLTVKFNSFIQPVIVLVSVPLSLVGVSIGLMLCGFNFSISAMIGVVALSGIVVNDAIVLVDFINRMRSLGVPLKEAVVYAGQLRLRPIFLTTITTIGGLLPLSLNLTGGGEFWQPLTVTMMFGLGFATLQQLFVIPLLCYTFGKQSSLLDPMQRKDLAGDQAEPMLAVS